MAKQFQMNLVQIRALRKVFEVADQEGYEIKGIRDCSWLWTHEVDEIAGAWVAFKVITTAGLRMFAVTLEQDPKLGFCCQQIVVYDPAAGNAATAEVYYQYFCYLYN